MEQMLNMAVLVIYICKTGKACMSTIILFIGNSKLVTSLQWRHNGRDDVSYHQPHECLVSRLFKRRSKKTSKLRVTCLCAGEFPAQMASSAENAFIWWRHHVCGLFDYAWISNSVSWLSIECNNTIMPLFKRCFINNYKVLCGNDYASSYILLYK